MDGFVGRCAELEALASELDAVRGGSSRFVLIEGEAGMGKSTLMARFVSEHDDVSFLRAGGDEAEMLMAGGVLAQLEAAGAQQHGEARSQVGPKGSAGLDPLALGSRLLARLGDLQADRGVVGMVIDDLGWSDRVSTQALLFTLRRLRADRVLVLFAARPGELSRLGESFERFLSGDERMRLIRLGGLSGGEVRLLAAELGLKGLSGRGAARLVEHTEGNPLYCRSLLLQLDQTALERSSGVLPAPRELASVVLETLGTLSEPARRLVSAAAVLGRRCPVVDAGALAGLEDPLPALEEAISSALVTEDISGPDAEIAFVHASVHAAVYSSMGPFERRRLHAVAGGITQGPASLDHRVAARVSTEDDTLADDLEAAGRQAVSDGQMVLAGSRLAQSSAAGSGQADREARLLDALEVFITCREVARANELRLAVAKLNPGARRADLMGHLDLLNAQGIAAVSHLLQAWEMHDPLTEPLVGADAATQLALCYCMVGNLAEAIEWGQRAVGASGGDAAGGHHGMFVLAYALTLSGRGPEGLDHLGFLPSVANEVPLAQTEALSVRGQCRLMAGNTTGALDDLSVALARQRAGVPNRYAGQCLGFLADAEYRLGHWDAATVHAELAVSLANDTERTWDYGFTHAYAALVPAARGDFDVAQVHVEASRAAADKFGAGAAIAAAVVAEASLASARGDLAGVLRTTMGLRAIGHTEALGFPGWYNWRTLEADALIGLGRLDGAQVAIDELEGSIPTSGLASASLAVARLRGRLATARGDSAGAQGFFVGAWSLADGLIAPFEVALLGLADGRNLRLAGDRRRAVRRLWTAHGALAGLGARPYAAICLGELSACGAVATPRQGSERFALSPPELAVAQSVAQGLSNKEVAAELFVSVKTVEYHLKRIFDKLGIDSRRAIASQMATTVTPPQSLAPHQN